MPPAFNLSQDQTLQFNLLLSHSKSHSCHFSLSKYWQGSSLEVLTFSCERLFLFLFLSTNVHTYHLFFFKDLFASTTSQPLIKRFVYLQQRNEIMLLFLSPVKPFFHFSQLRKKYLTSFSSLSYPVQRKSKIFLAVFYSVNTFHFHLHQRVTFLHFFCFQSGKYSGDLFHPVDAHPCYRGRQAKIDIKWKVDKVSARQSSRHLPNFQHIFRKYFHEFEMRHRWFAQCWQIHSF